MNKLLSTCAATLAIALSFGSASANEVVLTEDASKSSGRALALDFMSSGGATAFEFEIVVPKGAKGVDTSKCLSELPSSHTGACAYNPKTGRVVVLVYSGNNALLPEGVVSLGTISVDGMLKGSAGVEKVLVSDPQAQPLQGGVFQERASERRSGRQAER